jgi:predicted nucleotidyltransferase
MELTGDGILPRDYLETAGGWYFAVLLPAAAGRPVHGSLRYVRGPEGTPRKLDTRQANGLLRSRCPRFLVYSEYLDAEAVVVQPRDIVKLYKPKETIQRLQRSPAPDGLQQTALRAVEYLERKGIATADMGITGSLMLDFHNADSDIDIVIYDFDGFRLARRAVGESIASGELPEPDETMWLKIYSRRGCALDFAEYMKHEKRKYNKFVLDDTKIDINYVPAQGRLPEYKRPVRKQGTATITAAVVDASQSFGYPARYVIDNDAVEQILCYTATYTGQALAGERIEAAGMVEEDADGRRYMVIGTSREAPGEYLKVIGL